MVKLTKEQQKLAELIFLSEPEEEDEECAHKQLVEDGEIKLTSGV